MFSSGPSSRKNNMAGIGSGVLVPTRFVWPHGGKIVYLTGSFTGWSQLISMTPLEGCPTAFQAIWSLTPGYHQYKFVVDGEYRHDEHQPSIAATNPNIGIVNTVILTSGLNAYPPDLSSDTSRVNMEVDSEISPMSTSSGLPLPQGDLRISEADIGIFRHRISEFLSNYTAYQMMPYSGKEFILDVDLPVKQAFHILYEKGIHMAPLWDSRRGMFVGILSPFDFILILRELGSCGSNLTDEELETHTISAWKEGKMQMTVNGNNRRVNQGNLIHAGPDDSLKDVALKILQNDVATVPVIRSSSEDGSFPDILYLASLSEILKCICRQFQHSSSSFPILQDPIGTFSMGTWMPKIGASNGRPLAMLKSDASLSAALSLLIQAQVSSIPIVDDNDSLLDIYSRSDITALAKDNVYAQILLDEMSIQQALQLGQDAVSPFGGFNGKRCQMCLRSDSLMKVMERLSIPGVRRVIIVEAGSKRVEGIISLSDVFKFIFGLLQ